VSRLRPFLAALAVGLAATGPAVAQNTAAPGDAPAPRLSPQERGYAWAAPSMRALVAEGAWPAADAAGLHRDATRRQLARGLAAILAGRGLVPPANAAAPPDMPGDPDATTAGWVVQAGLMGPRGASFRPDAPVTGRVAGQAVVRAMGLTAELRGLSGIRTEDGARLRVPAGFAQAVLTRELGMRYNHPAANEHLERADSEPATVADLVAMTTTARGMSSWRLGAVSVYRDVRLPVMSDAQRLVVESALAQVGRPYVWGGDWPTPSSPWGAQAKGGFDCSGLVWMAFKGAARPAALRLGADLLGRTADDMAWEAPGRRVAVANLAAGDLVFYGDRGPRTPRRGIGHTGIAAGGGWLIHSAGSRGGPSLSRLDTYWSSGLAWGRRPAALGAAPTQPNRPETPQAPAVPGGNGPAKPAPPPPASPVPNPDFAPVPLP